MAILGRKTGILVDHFVLLGSEETNVVVDQYVSLDLVGEMATGNEFHPRGRADLVGSEYAGGLQVGSVASFDHSRQHPGKAGSRGVQEKVLTIVVERHAPRVRYAELGVPNDGFSLRAIAKESTVRTSLRTEHGLHVAVEEYALAHNEGSRWVGAKSGYGVVGVVVVETGKHDFSFVIAVITIRVAQSDEATAL